MAKETIFEDPPRGHVALLAYDSVNDRYRVLEVEGDDYPNLRTTLYDGNNNARVMAPSGDNRPSTYPSLLVLGQLYGFDGTYWDRLRCTDQKLDTVLHGWDGSAARKLPLLWGYGSRWYQSKSGVVPAAGYIDHDFTAVAAGEVLILQGLSLVDQGGTSTGTEFSVLYGGGTALTLLYNVGTAQWVPSLWNGSLVLAATDFVRARCYAPVGHNIYACASGYKMKVDQ